MNDNKKPIEDLWYLEDVTTLPKENTYIVDLNGENYRFKYDNNDNNWVAISDAGRKLTVAKDANGYSLTELSNGITSTFTVDSIPVKREGEGTGYFKDPDPRIDFKLDELNRQADINRKNGQTVTDFGIYIKDDPQPHTLRITYDASGNPQYSIINHKGESVTTTAADLGQYGITVSDTNNRYYPGGDQYAGTYVDANGNQINILKKKNADGTFSNDYEIYGNGDNGKVVSSNDMQSIVSGLTRDDRSAIRNGPGSSDQADIYDSEMHHHHVTKKITLSDITELNNQDISSYYGNSSTYQVNPDRYTMGTDGVVKSTGSRLDLILDLAHTNQWSVQDAVAYVNGYDSDADGTPDVPGLAEQKRILFANNGKTFNPINGEHDYWNNTYTKWLNDLSDANKAKSQADNLRRSVSDLQGNFKAVMDKLDGFCGEASVAAKAVLECILGKFAVTMANIENALEPACDAIMELVETLQQLQKKNDELQAKIRERNKLQQEMEKLKFEKKSIEIRLANTPSEDIEYDEFGHEVGRHPNQDYINLKNDLAAKNAEIDKKQAEIDKVVAEIEVLMVELDELTIKVETFIQLFINLETSVKTFSSIVEEVGSYDSASEVIAHHDQILEKFESYELMPVITNLTDYKIGDVVMFDDSYGTLYKVVGLDLESGRITIVAVDENGNVIGEPIEIWDQREIARRGEKPDEPKEDPKIGPSYTPVKTTEHHGDDPDPDPDPDPKTEPPKTEPPKTEPKTSPKTDPPKTEPETIPTTTPDTYPYTEYIPYQEPEEPVDIFGPGTGINSAGPIKSSGLTGLGALAGLAAGAAGIGAAALGKEEDNEKEKDEDKKEEHQSE